MAARASRKFSFTGGLFGATSPAGETDLESTFVHPVAEDEIDALAPEAPMPAETRLEARVEVAPAPVPEPAPRGAMAHPWMRESEGMRQESRVDSLRLIRAAAEFADMLERDAQEVTARQIAHFDEDIKRRECEIEHRQELIAQREIEIEREREAILAEARAQADDIVARTEATCRQLREEATADLGAAQDDAHKLITAAERLSEQMRQEAELDKLAMLDNARREIAEVSSSTRADVEEMMDWSRAQAEGIVSRAKAVAEQVLAASLRGDDQVAAVVAAVIHAADEHVGPPPAAYTYRPTLTPTRSPHRDEFDALLEAWAERDAARGADERLQDLGRTNGDSAAA